MDLTKLSNKELLELKEETETLITQYHNKQSSLKVLLNSCYGAMGNQYFRYFNIDIASAITLSAQLAINWIYNYVMNHEKQKKYQWKVIYADTDSQYIELAKLGKAIQAKTNNTRKTVEKIVEFANKVFQPIIDEGYEKLRQYVNANDQKMVMKLEKVSSKAFWTGGKNYALLYHYDEGVYLNEPDVKPMGLQVIKSVLPANVRKELKKVVKIILTEHEKLPDFISNYKKEFYKLSPEQAALNVGLNTFNKYFDIIQKTDGSTKLGYKPGTTMQARAAITYNSYLIENDLYNYFDEIKEGDKCKMIFLREPNPVFENVFAFINKIPDREKFIDYYDKAAQFNRAFLKPILNITEKINIPHEKTNGSINDIFG